MKPLFLLIIIFCSCNTPKSKPVPLPEADIPINTTNTVLSENNDTVYNLKKSPKEQFIFKISTKHGGDTITIQNQSK